MTIAAPDNKDGNKAPDTVSLPKIPNVLTIAGTDPTGGAGIQADIKAFSALGAYGMSVVTALVAQNTRGVDCVHGVPARFVAAQIDSVFCDVRVDAVKIGMVHTADVAAAIVDRLRRYEAANVVLDPMMVAKSGDRLLDDAAIETVRDHLLPISSIVTPNLPEAGVLLGRDTPRTFDAMREAARALHQLGPAYVLLKGGHLDGTTSCDMLFDGQDVFELTANRIATKNTHGTGCTLSAAIAALLPRHRSVEDAARQAKRYVTAAVRESGQLDVGHGHGPVHHFHALWPGPVRERDIA